MKMMIALILFAQSYPQWGSWYQQPIPHEYGGEARNPAVPVSPEDQLQQREVDREIMQNDAEDQAQQREVDYNILPQQRVEDLIQQRREDDIIQQGTGVAP